MNVNFKDELSILYFHDSEIESIWIDGERKCTLIINYYNWEGNNEETPLWKWKKVKIFFGFLAIIEWNSPDFKNGSSIILDTKYDEKLQALLKVEQNKTTKYPKYESPIFEKAKNHLSITFILNNFEDGINEDFGYLRLIGS